MASAVATHQGHGASTVGLEVLNELTDYVATEKFLHTLESVRLHQRSDLEMSTLQKSQHSQQATLTAESSDQSHTQLTAAQQPAATDGANSDGEYVLCDKEDFVVLDREDAVEAIAYYIALYVARTPEAQRMEPRQLHEALQMTFKGLRRSKFRLVWDWGRYLYRWSAMAYSMVQLYEHPWLVRVAVSAIWASSKMALGVLM